MAMTQGSIVVGVFPEYAQARRAIEALRRAGFSEDELGFLTRAGTLETEDDTAASTATGIVGGGVVGGVLGAAASLLIPGFGPVIAGGVLAATLGGAVLGAATGGLIGNLTGLGISESGAEFYQKELEAGRTIVTVKAPDGLDDAATILRNNGASDVRTEFSAFNARPPIRPYGAPPGTYDPTTGPDTDEDVRP